MNTMSAPREHTAFVSGFATPILCDQPDLIEQTNFISRAMILDICVRLALRVPGHIMEFGVADGASTRVIRRAVTRARWNLLLPHRRKKIYACDSFEGLPEAFENARVGTFAGKVPSIPGVTFVKGYFENSLTPELQRQVGRVAFAHLDADLYSSTRTVLAWLTPLLNTGSLLLFDEFVGHDFAEQRAFEEWAETSGLKLVRLGEFDRDPSGFGRTRPDRRTLFQVIGAEARQFRPPRNSPAWNASYYLGRLGLHELQSRLETSL